MAGIRFLAGTINFSLLHSVEMYSGAYPAFYSMGIGGKATGA
jgi:hypothetical protein